MQTDYSKVCEVRLTYSNKVKASERMSIKQSNEVYTFLKDYVFNPETIEFRESFKLILLNGANKILGFSTISDGGLNSTVADVRMVMQAALLSNATAMIIAHNHPSGQLLPSEEDKHLTNKIKSASEILNIRLLDHVIVTSEGFYSFADEGRI